MYDMMNPQQIPNFDFQMGYPQSQGYNTGFKRIPKNRVYQAIQEYCQTTYRVFVSDLEKIEETPPSIRHACYHGGISFLQGELFNVPTEFGMIQVPYYFCKCCGKLFVFQNFYD